MLAAESGAEYLPLPASVYFAEKDSSSSATYLLVGARRSNGISMLLPGTAATDGSRVDAPASLKLECLGAATD